MCPWLPLHPRRALPLAQGSHGVHPSSSTVPRGALPPSPTRPGQQRGRKGRFGFVPSRSDVI